ncbi:MAG: hypothetical protein ACI4TV_00195 [Paludibacteraceae bacterium]
MAKGTNGYVAELNKQVRAEYGEIPAKLTILIRKTAQDMCMLYRISDELDKCDYLVQMENGSSGQMKTLVNPLVPYYEKLSSRVTDDLYNLGLTARKQATKTEDTAKTKDPINEYLMTIQN